MKKNSLLEALQSKKTLWVMVFIVLFLPIISAVPPSRSTTGVSDFVIEVVSQNTLKTSQPFEFEVHVYNSSNGVPITSGISCYFHLYNITYGNHLVRVEDNAPSNIFDYEFVVAGGNFTKIGIYPYVASCNSSTQGGFYASFVEVNNTGQELTVSRSILFFLLCGVIIILLIADLIGISTLPIGNKRDDKGLISISNLKYLNGILILIAYLLLLALVFIGSNLAKAYLTTNMFGDLLFKLFLIMSYLLLPIIIIWFIWIFVSLYQDKELQRMISRDITEMNL